MQDFEMQHRSTFHDDPSMQELLAPFIARLAQHVQTLRFLIAQNNAEEIRRIAHQLKGAGKSYGFAPISAHAAAIEHAITTTQTLPSALPDLEALLTYIENIEGYASL
jgi:HPt (histidine-containing phosphotransfer) domain-containing protein